MCAFSHPRSSEVFCDLLVQTVVEGKRFEGSTKPAPSGADAAERDAAFPGGAGPWASVAAPGTVSWTRTAILGVYSGFCEAPLAYLQPPHPTPV